MTTNPNSTMDILLLVMMVYCAMMNVVINGQTTMDNEQPFDKTQFIEGLKLLRNVMQIVNKLEQAVGRLHEKLDQQIQTQQGSLTTFSQNLGQMNEAIHQQCQDIAQLNRTLVQVQYIDDQISQTLSQQNNAIRQMNENCARNDLVKICVNQTLVNDGYIRELGVKIDLQNRLNGQINEKLEQQSQSLSLHFNQTLSQQQDNLQQVTSSIMHHHELGLHAAILCSSIPRPTVQNATQSIKQRSNGTVITYTCNKGYGFSTGQPTRSTTCDGTSWTPVDGNCKPVCRPVLTHVIRGNRRVYALTSFNDQLFVTRWNSPIEVYDTKNFASTRTITVPGARNDLLGAALCSTGDCLYVSDYHNSQIHKLNLSLTPDSNSSVTTTSWTVGGSPRGLSVNRQQNLLVALHRNMKIEEYAPNGSLIREISASNRMWQAMEHVGNGTFVVSRDEPVHGVGLMTYDGQVMHSYGSATTGSEPGLMNIPRGLAVDRDGYVLVADEHNDRILVLNPTLSDARPLPLPTDASGQPLNNPLGLWLEESKGRLYIGEYETPYRVFVYDNVFNVGTLFSS